MLVNYNKIFLYLVTTKLKVKVFIYWVLLVILKKNPLSPFAHKFKYIFINSSDDSDINDILNIHASWNQVSYDIIVRSFYFFNAISITRKNDTMYLCNMNFIHFFIHFYGGLSYLKNVIIFG